MASYEIYWNDLTDNAKERLSGLFHENIGLSPLAIIDVDDKSFTDEEIADFKKEWGQSHSEICSCLGYDESDSDDILMLDYFWIEADKIWCNKNASGFTEREQDIADYLRLG
jgi:hypothetical protein